MFWRPDEVDEENFKRALDLVAFEGEPKLSNSAADDLFLALRRKEYESADQHEDRVACCFQNFYFPFLGKVQLDFLAKHCCLPLSVAQSVFPNRVWRAPEDNSDEECCLQSMHVAILVGDFWIAKFLLATAAYAMPSREMRASHLFWNSHTPETSFAGISALFFALLVAPDKHLDAWVSLLISEGARLSNLDSYTAGNIVAHDDMRAQHDALLACDTRLKKVFSLVGIADDNLEHALRSFQDDAWREDGAWEPDRRKRLAGVDTRLYTWLKEANQASQQFA